MKNLTNKLEERSDNGESVIIMGNFNEDVRKTNMEDWREGMGLREDMLDGGGEETPPQYIQ